MFNLILKKVGIRHFYSISSFEHLLLSYQNPLQNQILLQCGPKISCDLKENSLCLLIIHLEMASPFLWSVSDVTCIDVKITLRALESWSENISAKIMIIADDYLKFHCSK